MKFGTSLVVAAIATALFVAPNSAHAEAPTQSTKTVTVQSGDYLDKIASANSTTYERLYFANTSIADPDVIYPGDKIRIPGASETLTPRLYPTKITAAPVASPAPVAAEPARQADYYAPVATPAPTPAPVAAAQPAPVADGSVWDSLAQCESGGNWSINTGNGFYGGLQFTPSSWVAAGGSGSPQNASREEQIRVAENLKAMQGWGAWPACSAKLGLR